MEWISIKDRLPENDQIVITAHDGSVGLDFKVQVKWFDGDDNKFKSWKEYDPMERDVDAINPTVTHWMPLPESPAKPMTNSDGDLVDDSAWLCIKDFMMNYGDRSFTKGRYYYIINAPSDIMVFIDDQGDDHEMAHGVVNEYFKKIKRD